MIAPSLFPHWAGNRVKTDKRNAARLARLHQAGELTAIQVPQRAEEAIRDLVRTQPVLLAGRKRALQRITATATRPPETGGRANSTLPRRASAE